MEIICYGDSNTYGYDPRDPFGEPYPNPWPALLAAKSGWNVINQGENGREIPKNPVSFPENADLLIIMLGTNDLLQFWSPEAACEKMEHFLKGISLPVLLIAPPAMTYGAWVEDGDLIEDCRKLAECYAHLAQKLGIRFADASRWHIPLAYDGVHLTEEGHRLFARKLYQFLTEGV